MSNSTDPAGGARESTEDRLRARVTQLEEQLRQATWSSPSQSQKDSHGHGQRQLHRLLLLADSALPLGSFAFSSGLESFLAHRRLSGSQDVQAFAHFLRLSVESVAATTAPYVTAAFWNTSQLETLDNDLDASITCTVARRASVAQGRALVTVWERSFKKGFTVVEADHDGSATVAHSALEAFCRGLKIASAAAATQAGQRQQKQQQQQQQFTFAPNGHLPVIFGAVGAVFAMPLHQLLYLYLLNHAKTLLSAGVRSGVLGPYQAQSVLASDWLTAQVDSLVDSELATPRSPEEAGQSVPMIDLWSGRHEIVYSRIFNS